MVILFLLAVWLLWLRPLLDQRKFEHIDQTVTEIANQINGAFASKTVDSHKNCLLAGRPFGPEPIHCATSRILSGDTVTVADMAKYLSSQSGLTENTHKFSDSIYDFNLLNIPDVWCGIRAWSNPQNDNPPTEIEIKCTASAQRAHYGWLDPEEAEHNLNEHKLNAILLSYVLVALAIISSILWGITKIISKYKRKK